VKAKNGRKSAEVTFDSAGRYIFVVCLLFFFRIVVNLQPTGRQHRCQICNCLGFFRVIQCEWWLSKGRVGCLWRFGILMWCFGWQCACFQLPRGHTRRKINVVFSGFLKQQRAKVGGSRTRVAVGVFWGNHGPAGAGTALYMY
jgi:hypothetical protein